MMGKAWENFRSRPNVTSAAKVGEPSLEENQVTSATAVVRELGNVLTGHSNASIEQVKPGGEAKPNEATPRSDAGTSQSDTDAVAQGDKGSSEQVGGTTHEATGDQSGIGTLSVTKPSGTSQQGASSNNSSQQPAVEAPSQVNDANSASEKSSESQAGSDNSQKNGNGSSEQSSSKKKKKKKLGIF
jgi:hypothetical protein